MESNANMDNTAYTRAFCEGSIYETYEDFIVAKEKYEQEFCVFL